LYKKWAEFQPIFLCPKMLKSVFLEKLSLSKKFITFPLEPFFSDGYKTSKTLLMKKVYLLLLSVILLMNIETTAQCTFGSSFGTATINTSGATVTISTCSFAGEYSTINGAVSGQTLVFTSAAGDEITIHSGSPSGPVIAFGASPLTFANGFTGLVAVVLPLPVPAPIHPHLVQQLLVL
jgi:hypothetical protein